MIDKYYFIKGGAERYVFELSDALITNGHEVIPFSMKNPRNFKTPYEEYFVDNIEFNLVSTMDKITNGFKIFNRVIYSKHAQEKIEALINDTKPDVAHLHMIDHQISPSIISTLTKYNIPIIQTVHQYKIVCPNYRLYIEHKNEICERCIGGSFYNAFIQQCHKKSYLASALLTVESYVHKYLKLYEGIQMFHVPSSFMGEKLIKGGIPNNKVRQLFYGINIEEYSYSYDFEDYCVYFGRLSGEKGIHTLLKAMELLNNKSIKLFIIGEGPLRQNLEMIVRKQNLNNVQFLGYKSGNELKELIAHSKFVIVPSEWYDNSPLVIYEAFSLGTPVIGSKLGGISELIDNEKNGLLFSAGDIKELANQIDLLYNNETKIKQFSLNARKKAEDCFSWQNNYERLWSFYKQLLK